MTTLIICDIQPEYEKSFTFKTTEFTKYLNRVVAKYTKVIYFFNGPELGMINEDELKYWLYENGAKESLNHICFFEKCYGMLRNAIDNGIDDNCIIAEIKKMMKLGVYDTRDTIEFEEFNDGENNYLYWCDAFDEIIKHNKIKFIGGSEYACLKELVLVAQASDINTSFNRDFIY